MGIDFDTLRFAAPQYLWLLVAPGVLLVGWFWQLAARRRDARRYRQHRRLPVRERFPIFGSLVFWLCLILASASVIIANSSGSWSIGPMDARTTAVMPQR